MSHPAITHSKEEKLEALDAAIRYFDQLIGDEPFARHRMALIELYQDQILPPLSIQA